MSSYIPNVTDYIPKIQPFRPDFNFYQNALNTKQLQYKAGHDKLSNLYGTLLNSEMLREPNKEKRDEFFSQVQNDIQRMSTVDLSLEENVNTAYKVFQPIIDDKNISRDMAWTKNYRNEKQKGEYFRNCLDKECLGKYWKEGDEYLDYMASDFSKSTDDQAMRFQSPKYVPFVNVDQRANDVIKEFAPNVERVSFNGGYIFKTTNGDPITDQLQHYLVGILGNDAQINDVYGVKATLARQRYISSNAGRLGSEDAAESEYLNQMLNTSKESTAKNYNAASKILDNLNISSSAYTEFLKRNGYNPATDKEKVVKIEKAKQESSLMEAVLGHYKKTGESLENTLGLDKEVLRRNIDGAVSSVMFSNDMLGAAHAYASLHSKVDVKEDPYAMKAYEAKLQFTYASKLEEVKSKFKKQEEEYQNPLNYAVDPVEGYKHDIDKNAKTSEVQKETMTKVVGGYAEQVKNYLQLTQEQLAAVASDNRDPTRATLAKQALSRIFGKNVDSTGNLIEGFGKTADFYIEESPYYYQKMYANLIAENKAHGDLYYHNNDRFKNDLNVMESNIKDTSEMFKFYDDDVIHNNKTVVSNIMDKYKDDPHSKLASFMLKPNGHARNHEEFLQALYAYAPANYRDTPKFSKEARDTWNHLSSRFNEIMDKNDPGIDIRNVNLYGVAAIGGGGASANSVGWRSDMYDPHSTGTMNTLDVLKKDFPNAVSVLVGGNHTADDIKESDPQAVNLVKRLKEEMFAGHWKARGAVVPSAYMDIQPVAADSRGIVGYKITPSKEWLESISKITDKGVSGDAAVLWDNTNKRWKDDPSVTMYIPADLVSSSISKIVMAPQSVEEIKMKKQGYVNITQYPEGGTINIKKSGDGYAVSGTYFNTVDGKLVPIELPVTHKTFENLNIALINVKSNLATAQQTNQALLAKYRYAQGTISYDELLKQLKAAQ